MFYTPKYCCECGEKIEPNGRRIFRSRRFCEICETDFIANDWTPRLIIAFGILFGIFGIGSFLKKSDKPLSISTTPAVSVASNKNRGVQNQQHSANQNVLTLAQNQAGTSALVAQTNTQASAADLIQRPSQAKQLLADSRHNSAPETVYFCGAQTKKGMPCSRRVKGGGRCWQHDGQPAMLPAEKLVAGR